MDKKIVKVLRGLPGSGKTTLSAKECPGATYCSADLFHMVDGEYRWKRENASAAHAWCLRSFVDALLARDPVIVVDNTNTTIAELAPYCSLALAYGYDLEIVEVQVEPERAFARNVHGVPWDTIQHMGRNLDRSRVQIPKWWPIRFVDNREVAA